MLLALHLNGLLDPLIDSWYFGPVLKRPSLEEMIRQIMDSRRVKLPVQQKKKLRIIAKRIEIDLRTRELVAPQIEMMWEQKRNIDPGIINKIMARILEEDDDEAIVILLH